MLDVVSRGSTDPGRGHRRCLAPSPVPPRNFELGAPVLGDPQSDDPVELRDVVAEGSPYLLVVDSVLCVVDDDPHALDLRPGQLARAGDQLSRKLRSDVADASHHCLASSVDRLVQVPRRSSTLRRPAVTGRLPRRGYGDGAC